MATRHLVRLVLKEKYRAKYYSAKSSGKFENKRPPQVIFGIFLAATSKSYKLLRLGWKIDKHGNLKFNRWRERLLIERPNSAITYSPMSVFNFDSYREVKIDDLLLVCLTHENDFLRKIAKKLHDFDKQDELLLFSTFTSGS